MEIHPAPQKTPSVNPPTKNLVMGVKTGMNPAPARRSGMNGNGFPAGFFPKATLVKAWCGVHQKKLMRGLKVLILLSLLAFGEFWMESLWAKAVPYTILTADEIKPAVEHWKEAIRDELGEAQPKEVDYHSPEGQRWIDKIGTEILPLIIFDKQIVENDRFFDLVRRGMIDRRQGEYVIPEENLRPLGIMFFRRERLPNQLDVFIQSYCSDSINALRQLISYLKLYPENKVKIKCRFITVFHEFGANSPRGPEEIKENIRQVLVQKYYPDKFWDYLEKFRQRKRIEEICQELGMDAQELETRVDEGLELLKEDFALCKELSINNPPVFLWENQVVIPDIDRLKEFIGSQVEVGKQANERENLAVRENPGQKQIPVAFFYGPHCPVCFEVMNTFIPTLMEKFGDKVDFKFYDISKRENIERNIRLEEEYGVLGGGVPRVFVGRIALTGRKAIERELERLIHQLLASREQGEPRSTALQPWLQGYYPSGETSHSSTGLHPWLPVERGEVTDWQEVLTRESGETGEEKIIERFKSFAPLTIMGAGLLDGMNPCAFSTIIFFISFLAFVGFNRRQMLAVGFSFTLAVFLTYLALGLGAFTGLERLNIFVFFQRYFDKAVGILAIGLGVACLYDYWRFKKTGTSQGMLLQLPQSIKQKIHASVRNIDDRKTQKRLLKLLLTAFSVGIFVSIFESMCTGQVYLPVVSLILKMKMMWRKAFLFLLLYNGMFILPLLVVFILALFGVSSALWTKVVGQNLGKVKLATAFLFFSLGALMFLWT